VSQRTWHVIIAPPRSSAVRNL